MNSTAEWVASIPDQLTPRQALVYIQTALADADQAVADVRAQFKGTTPPPPWPKSPQLQQAIDAMDGGRLMMLKAIELGYGDQVASKTSPEGLRLVNAGRALYDEIGRITQRVAELPRPQNVPQLGFELAKAAAATKWGGLLVIGALLWLATSEDA